MPSEKSHRAAQRKVAANQAVRSRAKSVVAKAASVIGQGEDPAAMQEAVRKSQRALDEATQKKVVHPNNAARRLSRLTRRSNAAKPSA